MATAAAAIVLAAPPAWAGHDDHGPGTVIVQLAPGADAVVVVHPTDADRSAVRGELEAAVADAGLPTAGDVQVRDNRDPDTARAVARVQLSERVGPLTYEVPSGVLDAWRPLGDVVVETDRWVRVDGEAEPGEDVTYRIDPTVFLIGALSLALAAVVPFVLLRWYGARVVRQGTGETGDRVHRLRRATVAVQLVAPLVLVGALTAAEASRWPVLLLGEVTGGRLLPDVVTAVVGVTTVVGTLLVAFISAALGVLPHDRALRDTEQSRRGGASQALRGALIGLLPVVVWIVIIRSLPEAVGGWAMWPAAILFGIAVAAVMPLVIAKVQAEGTLDPMVRERVLEQCRTAGLAVRDVRLISSQGGRVANAAIAGVHPRLRYVFLTDELVERLDEDQLRAVVAHEIAHGKEHHILIKLAVGFVAVAGAAGLVGLLLAVLDLPFPVLVLAVPLLMAGALLLAHGVVGVRLEARADAYAARQTDASAMASALREIADANGTKLRTGWMWNVLQQHPGLADRLDALEADAMAETLAAEENR